jgi:putative drug exporter of the RND superfamily
VSTYLYRLARWCFRHRRRVLAGWLLAVVVVVVLSVLGHGTEDNNITIPGTES